MKKKAKADAVDLRKLAPIMKQAKQAAVRYYKMTGKPLGITSEVGEYEAARLCGVVLSKARQKGYDGIGKGRWKGKRIQVKTRRIVETKKAGQKRTPSISHKYPWDLVWLVLLNEWYEPFERWESTRNKVRVKLDKPGSISRNERRSLQISQFKSIGRKIWAR